MKTITAKQLRDNLEAVIKRVGIGESIEVTYRSKPAFTLVPSLAATTVEPGSPAAMRQFVAKVRELNATPRMSQLDPNKSTKELYHELLDNDPKYNGRHAQ